MGVGELEVYGISQEWLSTSDESVKTMDLVYFIGIIKKDKR